MRTHSRGGLLNGVSDALPGATEPPTTRRARRGQAGGRVPRQQNPGPFKSLSHLHSGMSENTDDIEEIRARKREKLAAKAGTPEDPVHVEGAAHLEELVSDHRVVLVDFYADWCGPCKMLAPTVETIAAETAATVAKVDIDAHQQVATDYGVQGVPTLSLFVDGEPTERMVGVQQESELRSLVEAHA